MEFPDDENGDVLRRLQESGDFTVVFPEKVAAQAFAGEIGGADIA